MSLQTGKNTWDELFDKYFDFLLSNGVKGKNASDCTNTFSNEEEKSHNDKCKCFTESCESKNFSSFTNKNSYQTIDENAYFVIEVFAPGYDEHMVEIKVDPTQQNVHISAKEGVESKYPWIIASLDLTVNLPKNLDYTSFSKIFDNGVIVISANKLEQKGIGSFTL